MTAYTPGPWKCSSAKFPDDHDVQEYGDTGAFYLVDTQDGGMPISLANAHLIAAAPEMLEALELLLAFTRIYGAEEVRNDFGSLITKANDAIAKAKGKV